MFTHPEGGHCVEQGCICRQALSCSPLGALRRLMQDGVWRHELEAKLEALGLNLEDIVHEP